MASRVEGRVDNDGEIFTEGKLRLTVKRFQKDWFKLAVRKTPAAAYHEFKADFVIMGNICTGGGGL